MMMGNRSSPFFCLRLVANSSPSSMVVIMISRMSRSGFSDSMLRRTPAVLLAVVTSYPKRFRMAPVISRKLGSSSTIMILCFFMHLTSVALACSFGKPSFLYTFGSSMMNAVHSPSRLSTQIFP